MLHVFPCVHVDSFLLPSPLTFVIVHHQREIGHNGKLLRLGLPQIQMDPLLLGTSAGLERNCTVLFSHLTALCGTKPAGEPHNPLQVHLRVDDGHRDTALQHIKVLYDVAVRHNPRTSVTVVPLAPLEYYETPNRNTNSREGHKLPLFTASLMTPNCGFNPVYKGVAVGGTFDRLHGGHKLLLTTALLHATQVLRIGVTVSTMLTTKIHADLIEPFEVRCAAVTKFAHLLRPDLGLEVAGIADRAGGADSDPSLEALVVSPETVGALPSINTARLSVGLKPLECVLVPYVGVCDDEESRVSSTNIRKRLCELST